MRPKRLLALICPALHPVSLTAETVPAGRAFVRAYYKYSPPPADFIAARSWLRATVRILLLPVVAFSWPALHQPLCLAGLMILPLVGLVALRRRRNTA